MGSCTRGVKERSNYGEVVLSNSPISAASAATATRPRPTKTVKASHLLFLFAVVLINRHGSDAFQNLCKPVSGVRKACGPGPSALFFSKKEEKAGTVGKPLPATTTMATEEEEETWGARLKERGYVIRRINLQNDAMMDAIYTLLEMTKDFPKQTQLAEFIEKQKDATEEGELSVVKRLPFDILHINSIVDEKWIDESKDMEFVGREDFADEVAEYITEIWDNRPIDAKEATSLVYSTVSGSGKTVSMLQLKEMLPRKSDRENIIVAYLGFNCHLKLSEEEKEFIRERQQPGAEQVLARRLLASVLLSKKYECSVTRLPKYASVYGNRTFPTVSECKTMLISELQASSTNPFIIVAGVDEVQLLDYNEFEKEPVGFGRFFLRTLRGWQEDWFEDGLVVLPLGTGVTLNFDEVPTFGTNKALNSGGDQVLISKEDFRDIVKKTVDEVRTNTTYYGTNYSDDFGEAKIETVIDVMASAYWPRVRLVEYWKRSMSVESLRVTDSNWENWPTWLMKWMRDDEMMVDKDAALIPGTKNGEMPKNGPMITALFQYSTEPKRFSVIPDGYSSLSMVNALEKNMPVPGLYDESLKFARVLNPKDFMIQDSWTFEKLGFHAVGTSLYIGLRALGLGEIKEPSDSQQRRIGLALWIQECNAKISDVPKVLGANSLVGKGAYYPFASQKQKFFTNEFLRILHDRKPVYIHTGINTCCDYLYLYPTQEDKSSWVAIVVDAKQTVNPEDETKKIEAHDQENLYRAAVSLNTALQAAGMSLTQVRLFFLSNRDGLSRSTSKTLASLKRKANTQLEILDQTSFEFSPYSDVLFARRKGREKKSIDVVAMATEDSLESCTVRVLKNYLREVGEKLSGSKPELIERVKDYVSQLESGDDDVEVDE